MVIALILVSIGFILQTIYLFYYKHQVKDISRQLTFITKHNSFKFVHLQIKPEEIYELAQTCNMLLKNKRELNQKFIKKNEEVNATMVSLSHDIRTPLTSLDGYLQLAGNTEELSEKSRYIKLAQSRMKHIISLVDELFFYTKLQNPEYNPELDEVDVNDVLQKSLLSVMDEFSRVNREPELHLPSLPICINGNTSALERIFENIFSNYFVHGKGSLSIHFEEQAEEITLHFTNRLREGHSLEIDKIFDRFYKEDPSRTVYSSGLGLFIVKSLMQKINGSAKVSLEDEEFCLSLTFSKVEGETNNEQRHQAAQHFNHRR